MKIQNMVVMMNMLMEHKILMKDLEYKMEN